MSYWVIITALEFDSVVHGHLEFGGLDVGVQLRLEHEFTLELLVGDRFFEVEAKFVTRRV